MSKRAALTVSLLLALAWPAGGGSQDRDPKKVQEDLETIRREIRAQQDRLQQDQSRQENVLQQLETLEKKIRAVRAEISRLRRRREELRREISHTQQRIEDHRRALERKKSHVARRLRARYQFGELGTLKVMLSSHSLADLAKRQMFLDRIFDQDRQVLAEFRATLAALETDRQKLAASELEVTRNEAERKTAEQGLIGEKAAQQKILAAVKEEKATHLRVLAELQESQKELEEILDRLDRRSGGGGPGLAALKGKLCFPVRGSIEEGFGEKKNPRFQTVTFNKGIDIRAPAGEPIHAVQSGTVLFADWFRGYGNLLILDHGDGYYSLYAHAEKLTKTVGDHMAQGETLGTVGETGSLKGPYLYFELRRHSQPLDPEPWLDKDC